MKILILGSNGQVGWELKRSLVVLGNLTSLDRHGRDYLSGDLSNPEAVAANVRYLEPDIIVNAAAYTAVDKAESEPQLARTINAQFGVPTSAELIADVTAHAIHFIQSDKSLTGTYHLLPHQVKPPGGTMPGWLLMRHPGQDSISRYPTRISSPFQQRRVSHSCSTPP